MTERIYAIGDIHGQLDQMTRVLALIEQDGGPDARIVFLGDYTDRGLESRQVLDHLIAEQAGGRPWIFLKGNHDRMFEWFMESPPRHDHHLLVGYHWFHERLGGIETMASYGVTFPDHTRLKDVWQMAQEQVPQAHVDFLRGLKLFHETDDLFFVHAGIRPDVPLADQGEEDLVWIRNEFHQHTGPHPKLIVHGHTPVDQATHYGNRVNLDTGAGYGRPLSAAVFEGGAVFLLTEQGRVQLRS